MLAFRAVQTISSPFKVVWNVTLEDAVASFWIRQGDTGRPLQVLLKNMDGSDAVMPAGTTCIFKMVQRQTGHVVSGVASLSNGPNSTNNNMATYPFSSPADTAQPGLYDAAWVVTYPGIGSTPIAIGVQNDSFALPVLSTGSFSTSVPPGWTQQGGTSGNWYPVVPGPQFGSTTEGTSDHFGYVRNGAIYQLSSEVVASAGINYTLDAFVGERADMAAPNPTVELVSWDGASLRSLALVSPTLVSGAFTLAQVSYTSVAADVGRTIGVRLGCTVNDGIFDSISLSKSSAAASGTETFPTRGGVLGGSAYVVEASYTVEVVRGIGNVGLSG